MDRASTIKILKQLNVTDLSGEKVMVDFEQGKYFMIKGVGNDIWDMLEDGITVEQIIQKLLSEYDVTEEVCEQEVLKFLDSLKEIGIIGVA
uniref:lasso peptide biosynthesis PqqD family chaperone n=1 Tax=Acetatifactor sp. TaxID=1872090 RepID=UPI004056E484